MNTDIQLLELAAKAVGFGDWTVTGGSLFIEKGCPGGSGIGFYWNPRIDDGDAFRLAIKLGISLDICEWQQTAFYGVDKFVQEDWSNGGDSLAAARRAILRAAAEIGKAMK